MAENEQEQTQVVEKKGGMDQKQERTWGMLCHLGGLVSFIPSGHIIAPLVLWLIKKDESDFVNDQGKEALNFQISMSIYAIVGFLLTITVILAIIGIPLLIAVGIFDLIMIILAAINSNKGERYRYPLCIRFIK